MLKFTVGEFVEYLREHLRTTVGEVVVQGEVSGFRNRQDSLVFFDLKDDESILSCFMMKYELTTPLEDGMEIRVLGVPSLFKKSGKLHLRVKEIELVGEGALRRALLVLQKKLQAEGLFDAARKRPLPRFPDRIGIITSPDAAAYTDVLRALKRRWRTHTIVVAPVKVQGVGSASDIVRAFDLFNRRNDIDVLIVTRGGGSLEDLQSFNSEEVARAIVGSRAPVVTGVGHERDFTIAELVADQRASTPTAAAELIAPTRAEVLAEVNGLTRDMTVAVQAQVTLETTAIGDVLNRLHYAMDATLNPVTDLLQQFRTTFIRQTERVRRGQLLTDGLQQRLALSLRSLLQTFAQQLQGQAASLRALNPASVLDRGYSMTFDAQGRILHDATTAKSGQRISTRLANGTIQSDVV